MFDFSNSRPCNCAWCQHSAEWKEGYCEGFDAFHDYARESYVQAHDDLREAVRVFLGAYMAADPKQEAEAVRALEDAAGLTQQVGS